MSRFLKTLIEAYEKRTNYFCVVVPTMVLAIDYITGRYIEFPILYALPVALAAWRLQYKLSSVMSILLPAQDGILVSMAGDSSTPHCLNKCSDNP